MVSALLPVFFTGVALCLSALAAGALTLGDLDRQGFRTLSCTFKERCVIGRPSDGIWNDVTWKVDDAGASAYMLGRDGGVGHKLLLMSDARWKERSPARGILSRMCEAVASHLTVFDGGSAVYALRYAGAAGSGQMLRGRCTIVEAAE